MSSQRSSAERDPLEELLVALAAGRLLNVEQVAEVLQLDVGWVYARATQLGALRLGSGKRAPIRFEASTLARRLREMDVSTAPAAKRASRRRTRPTAPPASGTVPELLPIRRRLPRGKDRAA